MVKPNLSLEGLQPTSAAGFRGYLAQFKESRDRISGGDLVFDCITETFNGHRREFYFEGTDKGRVAPLAAIHTVGNYRTFLISKAMPLQIS